MVEEGYTNTTETHRNVHTHTQVSYQMRAEVEDREEWTGLKTRRAGGRRAEEIPEN